MGMHAPGDGSRDTGTDAPWSASVGGLLLAAAALSALSLDGTTYPCPGPTACLRVMTLPPAQKWLLLGLAAGSFGFAAGVRRVPWSGRIVAATGALAMPAAGLTLYWSATYTGSLDAPASLATLVGGAGATGLLTYAAYRGRERSTGPAEPPRSSRSR